ncbi:hypothetical protein [Streptomyces indicus]|uniref:Uncharacterized protein n=1 Tax=Streptomyces indicus TaxID=417292 RepID=A0A1G8US59_9ACTN|nr:hypothetical protein [Streptomyces indicus]SDJ56504.1 hypothetical protein SAMN05421806_1011026 [Streptomyces indicus]
MGGFIDSLAVSLVPVAALLLLAASAFRPPASAPAKWVPDEPGADARPSADRSV